MVPNPNTQSDFVLLLSEIYNRITSRSPKFFRVFNCINAILIGIGGISTIMIEQIMSSLNLPHWTPIALKIVAGAGAWGFFMSQLAVAKPANLPFTEKKNMEKAHAMAKSKVLHLKKKGKRG